MRRVRVTLGRRAAQEQTRYLHAGVEEGLDGGGHAVLQLVLDGRHAHQLQVSLDLQHRTCRPPRIH